jgi:hypothetical protein
MAYLSSSLFCIKIYVKKYNEYVINRVNAIGINYVGPTSDTKTAKIIPAQIIIIP